MSFLYPEVLLSLLLLPVLGGLAYRAHRRAGLAWHALVSADHPELVLAPPRWRKVLPPWLSLFSLACVILALARPINGYEAGQASATGRNLLIALDISRSMETADVAPSRLEEARAAAYELIDALPGDKLGLIVFSGEADLVVPLTHDHTALRDALEQVNREWAGSGGTNFDQVIRCAVSTFARSAPDGANALVLLSDGEDTVDTPLTAARDAQKKNILVITVGVGTPAGGPIPDPKGDNGLWQDANGKHVISKLNSASLQRFAQATGGDFFLMGSGADLSAFARETAAKLTEHEENFDAGRTPHDLFAWFALPALLLALAGIVLGTGWRAPLRGVAGLIVLLTLLSPESARAQQLPTEAYAAGLSALKEKKVDAARECFSDALLSDDPELQAAAHLALGNQRALACFDKLRELYSGEAAATPPSVESLQQIVDELQTVLPSYRDAMRADPQLSRARRNADKVQELIKKLKEEIERLKNQQNQQNQQNQEDKQDKQNQQDKSKKQQNQQDQQDKQDQGGGQDEQNQQDKQDKQDQGGKQNERNQQDKPQEQDQQGKNDDKDQRSEQDKQDGKNPQEQQGEQDKGEQNQQGRQEQGDKQEQQNPGEQDANRQQAQQAELSDEEKEKQRAAGVLRMHVDEVGGSPIPHVNAPSPRPLKDY